MRGWPVALLATVAAVLVIGVLAVVTIAGSDGTSIFDLEVGDCFDLPVDGAGVELDTVDTIDCTVPHEAEVLFLGELNPNRDREYPSDDVLFAELDARCAAATRADRDAFGMVPVAPNERSWELFKGAFLCVAIPFGGQPVTGSIGPG